jgi:glycosyltransferase involved in cell wall biosynthesis
MSPAHRNANSKPIAVYAVTVGLTARVTIRDQLINMKKRGYRVILLCAYDEETASFTERAGIEFIPIPMKRGFLTFRDLRCLARATVILRKIKPDVVHFSTPKAALLIGLASFLSRVPTRVYGMTGLRLEGERPESLRYRMLRAAEYLTCKTAHAVLQPSESLRDRTTSLRLVRPNKALVLGRGSTNGVDLNVFQPASVPVRGAARAKTRIDEKALVFGFVGRVVADKGIHTLIRAFDLLPQRVRSRAVLLLVGHIEENHLLPPGTVRRIGDDPDIIMTGFVENPSYWYRVMDVLVLPSRREGFPNVVLEAAASGLPTITTDVTGCRDAVDDDVTGFIVPVDDPHRLAEAMTMLADNPAERVRMGAAARALVERHYDRTAVLTKTADFIESLMDHRASAELARSVPNSPK